MKIEIKKLVYSALFATTLFLAGCADAGSDQVVTGSSLVTLDANNSTACVGGEIKKYKWKQTSGTHVDIDNNTNSRITFIAPSVETETVLEFRLKTVEKGGHPRHFRSYDWVKITVQPRDTNDTTAPRITLAGDNPMTLHVGEIYVEPGATAVDDVDANINVTITGEVDTSTVGTYIVTYTATDSANNVATAQRIVIVTANTTGIKSISNNVSTEEGEATYNVEMYAASTEQTYAITITTRDGETVVSTPIFTAGVMYDGTQGTITVPVAVENFSLTLPILEDNLFNTVSDPFIITIGGVSNPPIEEGVHDIDLTADWMVPENALFLDIREDWERVESRPVGAIGGAVYGTRNFVDSVLSLAENDKSKQIILICRSGSRTEEAVHILSNEGFLNVWQIVGGMIQWTAVKPDEILSGPL